MPPDYSRRLGVLRNPAVAREIARLDARADCQRIVHLLSAYEYPWDFQRALELALFYTYGSASVARLLDGTGEFRHDGQKRYDDTRLLMTHIIDSGYDGDIGRRALARMNRSHGHYRIAQDDFWFVLWTFIEFPIRWARDYGWRPMTAHEQEAWFRFWRNVGDRMGLAGLPDDKAAFDRWVEAYKAREFRPNAPGARVARDTVHILEHWFPAPLRGPVAPVVYAFFDDDPAFLAAIGVAPPPRWLRPVLTRALRALARVKRELALGAYPTRPDSPANRTYGTRGYVIEDLRPHKLGERERADGAS